MIVITGSIVAAPETFNELFEISLEHVARSRKEKGCRLHSVHVDAENGLRLVFLEHWDDRASVLAHFAQPESKAFVARARELAAEPPEIRLFRSEEMSLHEFTQTQNDRPE